MKIICVGRNYVAHARELGNQVPEKPVIFLKPQTALLNKGKPFFYPDFSSEIHYEAEVVVRISRTGKHIHQRFASKYYDAITLGIDFTARDLQREFKQKGLPWDLAKAFDGSAAIGSFILLDEAGELTNLDFHLVKNGETVQKGNTSHMIFSIDFLISFVSRYFTLQEGDLLFTGTPEGVGRVVPGDELHGFIRNQQVLSCPVR